MDGRVTLERQRFNHGAVRKLCLASQRKRHDRPSLVTCALLGLDVEGIFDRGPIHIQFRGKNLYLARSIETQLAYANAILGTYGRPEDPARHGTRCIEVAGAGEGVENRTGFIVGKIFKLIFVRFMQNSRCVIAGKLRRQPESRLLGADTDSGGPRRIGPIQLMQSCTQTKRIQLADGEDADAALRASRAALQPFAGSAGGVGRGRIHNLHQISIRLHQHIVSIVQLTVGPRKMTGTSFLHARFGSRACYSFSTFDRRK
jgi:hypothetical protein